MKIIYKCEICGNTSETKSKIQKCEKQGIPRPLLNIGDTIYFKDCEETPVVFGMEKDFFSDLYDSDIIGMAIRKVHSTLLNNIYEYKIRDIKIDGHSIKYILEGPTDCTANVGSRIWHYPTIHGNTLMRKIISNYNNPKPT